MNNSLIASALCIPSWWATNSDVPACLAEIDNEAGVANSWVRLVGCDTECILAYVAPKLLFYPTPKSHKRIGCALLSGYQIQYVQGRVLKVFWAPHWTQPSDTAKKNYRSNTGSCSIHGHLSKYGQHLPHTHAGRHFPPHSWVRALSSSPASCQYWESLMSVINLWSWAGQLAEAEGWTTNLSEWVLSIIK